MPQVPRIGSGSPVKRTGAKSPRGTDADFRIAGAYHASTPYIKRLRSLVPEITEPTLHAACSLLLCQALQSFQAVLLLAADGFHYQMSELLRGIREALAFVVLFLCEGQQSPNLKKWFDGEIIPHRVGRVALAGC